VPPVHKNPKNIPFLKFLKTREYVVSEN